MARDRLASRHPWPCHRAQDTRDSAPLPTEDRSSYRPAWHLNRPAKRPRTDRPLLLSHLRRRLLVLQADLLEQLHIHPKRLPDPNAPRLRERLWVVHRELDVHPAEVRTREALGDARGRSHE